MAKRSKMRNIMKKKCIFYRDKNIWRGESVPNFHSICANVAHFLTKEVPTGFEPATFCVLSRRDNHYTTEPTIL